MSTISPELELKSERASSAALSVSRTPVSEIADLCSRLPLMQDDTWDPRLFLASVSERQWIPHVIVVRKAGSITGVVFAKERKVAGFASGLVYCDGILLPLVVSYGTHSSDILYAAIKFLIQQQGIRVYDRWTLARPGAASV